MSRATAQPPKPYQHPTGRCTDEGCKGELVHKRSVPASNEQNPGQEEYECSKCHLLHIVSRRRWDDYGDVIRPPEQEA